MPDFVGFFYKACGKIVANRQEAIMMKKADFLVVTLKPWNISIYNEKIRHFPGNWFLITSPDELTIENLQRINPELIFFPHWSHKVPAEIVDKYECICFHMTDLPFGRGGSPLQNLIARGIHQTVISALRMTDEIDAGPVYMKEPLSLEGLAEEIFIRAADKISGMIEKMVTSKPEAVMQTGEPVFFKRRKPDESIIDKTSESLSEVFDHIRMLDADGYPKACIEFGKLRFEFSRPALRADGIIADAKISMIEKADK